MASCLNSAILPSGEEKKEKKERKRTPPPRPPTPHPTPSSNSGGLRLQDDMMGQDDRCREEKRGGGKGEPYVLMIECPCQPPVFVLVRASPTPPTGAIQFLVFLRIIHPPTHTQSKEKCVMYIDRSAFGRLPLIPHPGGDPSSMIFFWSVPPDGFGFGSSLNQSPFEHLFLVTRLVWSGRKDNFFWRVGKGLSTIS